MKFIAQGSVVAAAMVVLLGPLAQAQLEESYNMASPYVESKEPLSSLCSTLCFLHPSHYPRLIFP
jgi:hypothetical protein